MPPKGWTRSASHTDSPTKVTALLLKPERGGCSFFFLQEKIAHPPAPEAGCRLGAPLSALFYIEPSITGIFVRSSLVAESTHSISVRSSRNREGSHHSIYDEIALYG